jgi:hypothetical protein
MHSHWYCCCNINKSDLWVWECDAVALGGTYSWGLVLLIQYEALLQQQQ